MTHANNYVRYSDIRDQSKSLEVAAFSRDQMSLGIGAEAAPVCVECVTSSYFPILGARPVVGRIFSSDEDAERRAPGAMLSYSLWQNSFGGDPRALGESVTINGRRFSIIGIAHAGFRGVESKAVDAWILLPVSPDICSFTGKSLLGVGGSAAWMNTIGKIRDGFTISQAAAEIESQASPEAQFERATSRNRSPELQSIQETRRDRDAEAIGALASRRCARRAFDRLRRMSQAYHRFEQSTRGERSPFGSSWGQTDRGFSRNTPLNI